MTDLYTVTLGNGHTQHRCPTCGCGVRPTHVPGSEACDNARIERDLSRNEW